MHLISKCTTKRIQWHNHVYGVERSLSPRRHRTVFCSDNKLLRNYICCRASANHNLDGLFVMHTRPDLIIVTFDKLFNIHGILRLSCRSLAVLLPRLQLYGRQLRSRPSAPDNDEPLEAATMGSDGLCVDPVEERILRWHAALEWVLFNGDFRWCLPQIAQTMATLKCIIHLN